MQGSFLKGYWTLCRELDHGSYDFSMMISFFRARAAAAVLLRSLCVAAWRVPKLDAAKGLVWDYSTTSRGSHQAIPILRLASSRVKNNLKHPNPKLCAIMKALRRKTCSRGELTRREVTGRADSA